MKKKKREMVTKTVFLSCILSLLVLVNLPVWAVSKSDNDTEGETLEAQVDTQVHELTPVLVVGDKKNLRQDLKPGSLTNIYRLETSAEFGTETFKREDIQDLQPKDIYDLIDRAAGMEVTYQGRKSPYFIRMRGGGSFTYIIDGAVLPPSVNRILYKFPLSSIEELKVVRGATSLTLGPSVPIGASRSGGGINTGYIILRTRQPKKTEATLKGSVEKSIGGHPVAYNTSLYAGTRLGKTDAANGYVGALASKMDRDSQDCSNQDTWFDGQEATGGMVNGGFTAGKFRLNMMAYQDEGRFEMQRGVKTDGTLDTAKWYYDPLKVKIFSADGNLKWTPNQVTLLNVFKTDYEQHEHNESFSSSSITEKDEYNEDTKGFGLRHNARFGGTLVQAGMQWSSSTGFGPNLSKGYNRYDTTVTGYSASVEQQLFSGKLVLDAGGRWDIKHIDNSSAAKSASLATDDANNDVDMAPAKVFALGSHWQMTEKISLDSRYYYGEQGTTGDFDMRLVGDATPHAEKQRRIEAALDMALASFFNPMLTWFDIDTKNKKTASSSTYDIDGSTYYYYTEADEVRQGVEVAARGRIGKNTSYKVSWTRMLKNDSTSSGVTTDQIGLSTPENLWGVFLKHTWRDFRANLSVKKSDSWLQSSSAMGTFQPGGLGGYTRIDANIAKDFMFEKILMTVTLFGRNLGDDNYSTRYTTGYYPDRGRTLGMELAFSF